MAKVIYTSPDVDFNLPPPQAMVINCLSPILYTAGVANAANGNSYDHNSFPFILLNALNILSGVPAIKINPPAVATGPP